MNIAVTLHKLHADTFFRTIMHCRLIVMLGIVLFHELDFVLMLVDIALEILIFIVVIFQWIHFIYDVYSFFATC